MTKLFQRPMAQLLVAVAIVIAVGSGFAAEGALDQSNVQFGGIFGQSIAQVGKVFEVNAVGVVDGHGGTAVVASDGTYFAATANVFPGESYQLNVSLDNQSGEKAIALVSADAPDGFKIALELPTVVASVTGIARLERNRWLIEVWPSKSEPNGLPDLIITVAASPGIAVGDYNISYDISLFDPKA